MRIGNFGIVALVVAGVLACGSQQEPPGVPARTFVAAFYTWYLLPAEKGGAGGSLETAIRSGPQLLDSTLLAALREDIAASAANPGEVAGLDFDPFVNSQDACEQYVARPPIPVNNRWVVPVDEVCGGKAERTPALRVEVVPFGDSLRIANLVYDDSSTLLSVLAKLKASREPPPLILGRFEDDYGNSLRLSPALFEQLPRNRYHIVEWNVSEQYFVARNDSANSSDKGLWTRVDWMPFDGMAPYTWGFCMTAYRAPTRDSARATTAADRSTPRTGCGSHPFSRMKPVP